MIRISQVQLAKIVNSKKKRFRITCQNVLGIPPIKTTLKCSGIKIAIEVSDVILTDYDGLDKFNSHLIFTLSNSYFGKNCYILKDDIM